MLRRLSLRWKAYVVLGPAVLVVAALAWSAVSPYRGVGDEVATMRLNTARVVAGQRFLVALAAERKAFSGMVAGAAAPADAAAAGADVRRALTEWQVLAGELAGDENVGAVLAELAAAHERLERSARDLEALLAAGDRAGAAALVTGDMAALAADMATRAGPLVQSRQTRLVEGVFRLAGVLDRADPLGFGGPSVDTEEVTLDLSQAVLPAGFARSVLDQARAYDDFVATGAPEHRLAADAARDRAQAALASMRGFTLGSRAAPAERGPVAELARLGAAHDRLTAAGGRAVEAHAAGQPDAARAVLAGELPPVLAEVLAASDDLASSGERTLDGTLDEVESGMASVRAQLAVVVALAALAVVAAPVLVSRRLVRPIRELREAAVAVGAGDLDARATTRAGGELGELAAAFNTMVADLQASRAALMEAREEAVRASGAKDEFLSRMSHELRTPLNAILGFGQLLEADDLDADQRDAVEQIVHAGRHLLELINEVLEIARIESGNLAVSLETVRVSDVLDEAVDLVRPLARSHDVALAAAAPAPCDAYVRADRQRLKQVVLNLLANAVKYNRPGGTVALVCERRPGGRVRLGVRDTGWGIAEDMRARLFTPFDRLGAEQSGVVGTGLGLALADRLTKAMDGTITVDSALGEGSTFWVELAERPAPELREVPAPAAAGPLSGPDGPGRTVLYIEDNLSNLRLVERIFTRWPAVTLVPAMQGSLGVALARDHEPDLILLDLNLPDLSGREVLARLKEQPETRAIPVVVISADATPGQVQRLLDAGAVAYLTKPIDVVDFVRVVSGALPN